VAVLTTSTSGILWTGLKKCNPATRSGWVNPPCKLVTDNDDVFVARIALGGVRLSSSWTMARFAPGSSIAASITRSTLSNPSHEVVGPRMLSSFWRGVQAGQ